MSDITIIGGGWSVRNVDLQKLPGTVIAVNDSAILAPHWEYAVSMDRLWAEGRIDRLLERCAETFPKRKAWIRKNALQNITAKVEGLDYVQEFDCDHRSSSFSRRTNRLNGTNSGACALNLAWQLKPRRVFLLGFDMNRDPGGQAYWYPPYPWTTPSGSTSEGKYQSWAKQFETAALAFSGIGCSVFNVSPSSAIQVFKKMTPEQFAQVAA